MIEQAYLYLIVAGATILGVLAALWVQARKASGISLALIRHNEHCQFDLPRFLDASWPLLAPSGLMGMGWQLDWFGVRSEKHFGIHSARQVERTIAVGEMAITLTFYRHEGRGERRYFEETLLETFALLLRTDMLIKAATTDAALAHMSRLNLFLQHDMKIIAQFVQLLSDQLNAVPPGKEARVLDHLRRATPLIRERADRIVRALTLGSQALPEARPMHLAASLAAICSVYDLAHSIQGDALVQARDDTLDTVFDNMIKNYHDLALREGLPHLHLEIAITRSGEGVEVSMHAPAAPAVTALDRLFEPFWSSDPAGLGIGLYQARHLLEAQGGSLTVRGDAGQAPTFFLRLAAPGPA